MVESYGSREFYKRIHSGNMGYNAYNLLALGRRSILSVAYLIIYRCIYFILFE